MTIPGAPPGFTLQLRRRTTPAGSRWELTRLDPDGSTVLAYAGQSRVGPREPVTFWCDGDRRDLAFTVRARDAGKPTVAYDVVAGDGASLAVIGKSAVRSLVRSTYAVRLPDGAELVAAERGSFAPAFRRLVRSFDLPPLLTVHLDVTAPDGRVVVSLERRPQQRDVCTVRVADPQLDWRVAAATAIASDAFLAR